MFENEKYNMLALSSCIKWREGTIDLHLYFDLYDLAFNYKMELIIKRFAYGAFPHYLKGLGEAYANMARCTRNICKMAYCICAT